MDFPYLFEHAEKNSNTLNNFSTSSNGFLTSRDQKPEAVDIDYSCLWIVLLAERISCVLQMKDFFMAQEVCIE